MLSIFIQYKLEIMVRLSIILSIFAWFFVIDEFWIQRVKFFYTPHYE